MLTREHAIVAYEGDHAIPDRLTSQKHRHYLPLAARMCAAYREGIGQTRQSLHRAIERIFADELDCPNRRVAAFCKLLDESSEFIQDEKGNAAKLRQAVFSAAAPLHPLVTNADPFFENDMATAHRVISETIGKSWPEIDDALFSDLIEFQRMKTFAELEDPKDLLSRYNVAQVQVALFDALRMTIWASSDLKSILRYAKLARLMHRIERLSDGTYRFDFDGPASLLNRSHRYGVAMARFLPGLLSCRGWKMRAILQPARWHRKVFLDLDDSSGLKSPVEPVSGFDSKVEENFFHQWNAAPRMGWRLERESEILHQGQKTFVPDFVFVHEDGRRVLFEVIGFWTPEYLQQKWETLQLFQDKRILLAVAKSIHAKLPIHTTSVVLYKTEISVDEVVKQLVVS